LCSHPGQQSPKGGKMGGKMNILDKNILEGNVLFSALKKF
jgi:hypothetical protein